MKKGKIHIDSFSNGIIYPSPPLGMGIQKIKRGLPKEQTLTT